MYRPKFCAECGEKIIRLRWRIWTNRKFCDSCAPRFIREQSLRFGVLLGIVLLVGMTFGRAMRPSPPPLIIHRAQSATLTPGQETSNTSSTPTLVEEVYTCGARTKKGTPCSRRVHGPVRCWQHKGMAAMMPQEKLRIKDGPWGNAGLC